MVIFHSYVSLPEGKYDPAVLQDDHWIRQTPQFWSGARQLHGHRQVWAKIATDFEAHLILNMVWNIYIIFIIQYIYILIYTVAYKQYIV